jgi:hypothetical protein
MHRWQDKFKVGLLEHKDCIVDQLIQIAFGLAVLHHPSLRFWRHASTVVHGVSLGTFDFIFFFNTSFSLVQRLSHVKTVENLGSIDVHVSAHHRVVILLDIINFGISTQSSQRVLGPPVVHLEWLHGMLPCFSLFYYVQFI